MKKKLLFVVVTVLALASCSSDETVAVKQDSPISFRPFIEGVTRTANGAGLKSSWETGDILHVYADFHDNSAGTDTKYFQADFTKQASGGFTSANNYYWPTFDTGDKITFTAFWGADQKTSGSSGYQYELASKFTVDNTVANQKDLLIAKKAETAKVAPVVLNFRHMLSQVVVKVRNTEANMKITITGVRIGYAAKTGSFKYTGDVTDARTNSDETIGSATLIARTNWTIDDADKATAASDFRFDQDVTLTLTGSTAAQNLTGFKPYIMMPQQLTLASAYSIAENPGAVTTVTDPKLTGAYIALKMAIVDNTTAAPILAEQWCYWPIGTEWKPGYKYTYTIDAGQGGYQPTDQNDDKTTLDPVFDNSAYIWFSPACTIDYWVDAKYGISMPVARSASYAFGTDQAIPLDAGANGPYDILITGLTVGHTISAAGTNNFTASPTVTPTTVADDGEVHITGTLTANTTAVASSVITITDETSSTSMTITITQDAP